MLTAYGSEINGLISSILQFISYFNLVEAGLSSAAVYSLYKPIAEKDYNRINRIVVAAKHFYVKSGFIFVGLVVILAICYPFITDSTVLDQTSIFVLVLVLGVNGSLEFFTLAKYRALLTADQRTYVISLASIVYTVLNTIIVVALSIMHINIVLLRIIALLAMFFYLYAYEPIHAGKGWKNAIVTWYQKFKESVFFRKMFFLAFLTSLILFRTLLNRQLWMNPLSDVMGGWGIWRL